MGHDPSFQYRRSRLSRREFLRMTGALAAGLLATGCQPLSPAPAASPEPSSTAPPPLQPSSTVPPLPQPTSTAIPATEPAGAASTPVEPPLGIARGIHPGRVVWAHNPQATRWDGTSSYWWSEESTDAGVVSEMLSQALRAQTGDSEDAAAWDALFRHFNGSHGRGNTGYRPGEGIAVKVNLNSVSESRRYTANGPFPAPQLVLALLRQLVAAGVPASAITVYDAIRYIPDAIYDSCQVPELAGVHFVDWAGLGGREKYQRDPSSEIRWSGQVNGSPTYLPTCVTRASYLINLASLKGHNLAGVTLCAKNHFGTICADLNGTPSQTAPQGAAIHGTVAANDFNAGVGWTWPRRPMGTYSALVDLMAHRDLGEKTLLFMLDALYVAQDQSSPVTAGCRWQSPPFDGHWTSSLFLSQDGVAIDSTGYDFLREEPSILARADLLPPGNTAENYLHEAAQAGNPPSGTAYAPASLGVHEHWNDATRRQYSRNPGTDQGIELVKVG